MSSRSRTRWLWALWLSLAVAAALVLTAIMFHGGEARRMFLIGKTTGAHHQMELACESCHTSWFGGAEALQKGCLSCHAEDLAAGHDSHPVKKFRDPRNADRLAALDAMKCVTCHREHHPEITRKMAVTLPDDFCVACHEDIGDDRPSHEGLAFDTCASAGCHNFHDNRALYEDFLEEHQGDPDFKGTMLRRAVERKIAAIGEPLALVHANAPAKWSADKAVMDDWQASSHAKAGVNCGGCHTAGKGEAAWIEKPGMQQCATCHAGEAQTFVQGKHGMRQDPRLEAGSGDAWFMEVWPMSPMTPGQARLPMKDGVHDTALTCNTCHAAHGFDRKRAAVEACATCHDDGHSRAYFQSPHYRLWQAELAGTAPAGSGVSCATCHMPAESTRDPEGQEIWRVTHNQNANLRPSEKMVRSVCLDCHGLGFTLDALADAKTVGENFTQRGDFHVESLDWVRKRMRDRGALPERPADNPETEPTKPTGAPQ
ncbi:MAG: cytochrome c3 family protein [Sphingomonadales bacterium]